MHLIHIQINDTLTPLEFYQSSNDLLNSKMFLAKEEIYEKVGFSALTVDHDHSCMYESMIGQLSVTISPLVKRIEAGRTNYVTCPRLTVVQRGRKKPLA